MTYNIVQHIRTVIGEGPHGALQPLANARNRTI